MGCKVVSTYHPRDLIQGGSGVEFKGYWNRQIIIFDMKRALAQSIFTELKLPQRVLEICKNSAHLAEFRARYKHLKRGSVDIEAGGTCLPICIGLAFTKSHGMCIPLWNQGGISSIPDSDLVSCWIILAEILAEMDVVGQYFNYDRDKIKRLGFIIKQLISDTMYKAFCINPELLKGLAFNTSIYTEEPFYKDEGMYQGRIEDLLIGCARDACVTLEVDQAMDADIDELNQRQFYENFLMKLPEFYASIEQVGFLQDTDERDRLLHKYIEWDERLRHELFSLTGTVVNVASPKQVYELLFIALKLPTRKGTGEEELTSLLNLASFTNKDHRRIVELILEDRRVRNTVSSHIMALPDYDGRMRTTYFPCLETGRSSTNTQEPPIRPSIEVIGEDGKKKNRVLGKAFQTMTKHGDIGQDVRGMYVVDPGDIFVQADKAQAEARVVFLLADDEQALKDIDEHDYHALTSSWFFGGVESDYSKKVLGYESPIRFAGKTLRHAGHLGAGKRRAATEVNTQARKYKIPININEAIAERALKIFHLKQPKIQQIFHYEVVECLKRDRRLIAPLPYGIDAPIGGLRTFYERWGDELNRQAFSYLPQRAISDSTKADGMRILKRIPVRIILEAHDALLFSFPERYLDEFAPIIKEEMEKPIRFSSCSISRRDLVVPCDVEIGYNYEDFSKFKFPVMDKVVLPTRPMTVTEEFLAEPIGQDTYLDNVIYENRVRDETI